jgi:hypothetical protein
MQLRLAQYNAEGKFEKFLECGKDFMYGESFIFIHNLTLQCHLWRIGTDGNLYHDFKKDEKDPLNRFNGLFNGRTYGEGKFVLSKGYVETDYNHPQRGDIFWEDDVFKFDWEKIKNDEQSWKENALAEKIIFILAYGNGQGAIRIMNGGGSFDIRYCGYTGFYTKVRPNNDSTIFAGMVDLQDCFPINGTRVKGALQTATPVNCYLLQRVGNLHENPELWNQLRRLAPHITMTPYITGQLPT